MLLHQTDIYCTIPAIFKKKTMQNENLTSLRQFFTCQSVGPGIRVHHQLQHLMEGDGQKTLTKTRVSLSIWFKMNQINFFSNGGEQIKNETENLPTFRNLLSSSYNPETWNSLKQMLFVSKKIFIVGVCVILFCWGG